MSFIVLQDYVPLPRYDGSPWTRVLILESADEVTWNQIDEIIFSDPDPDPTNPRPRSFSSDNAVLDKGWYQVVWQDAAGNQVDTDPVLSPPEDPTEFMPQVEEVSALLRARTKDSTGNERGVFTEDTTPDADGAQRLIEIATGIVATSIGEDIPDVLIPQAQTVTSWLAAMLIELAYFPEQVATDRSAYQQYKELYDEAIGTPGDPGALVVAVQNALLDNTVDISGSLKPVGKFPPRNTLKW
jgi:hypothetical protein